MRGLTQKTTLVMLVVGVLGCFLILSPSILTNPNNAWEINIPAARADGDDDSSDDDGVVHCLDFAPGAETVAAVQAAADSGDVVIVGECDFPCTAQRCAGGAWEIPSALQTGLTGGFV